MVKVNSKIVLDDYKNYWIGDTSNGHQIKICYGKHDNVLTINCNWKNRKRTQDKRVVNTKG